MLDEARRKEVVLEYCRLMNAGDLDGVLALFTPDVRFEDPVGSEVLVGREALGRHLGMAIAAGIEETPGTPTAALDGTSVTLAVSGTMGVPGAEDGSRVAFRLVSLMRVNEEGLISETRIIAGRSDLAPVD
ncbi:nuclear transport factor 2 family protein [Streptomyces cinnabarinus]|uniref:Nuclear transport factor 2 family protein n=1 Tax=Streptomyces cinnabarinus TaxID=67287 RepID=A0ABY7KAQ6_9ACTN|nr:nuclear transport factor 2 family protein [Streptomyces cinnabarinus]WAZ20001.1 nuclear transport factor 2 family protein [Streptomyces cinnabarinus]